MLKFLRKYNKIILVVGGSLLMIVFLVPQALTQSSGATRGPVLVRFDGGSFRERDLFDAAAELQLIDGVLSIPGMGLSARGLLGVTDQNTERMHWLLLRHEAERAGFVGGPSSGADMTPLLAQMYAQFASRSLPEEQRSPESLNLYATFFSQQMAGARESLVAVRGREVDVALARAMGVLRMLEAYGSSARLSAPEAIAVARDYFDAAEADIAAVSAEMILDEVPEPDEETLRAHFERYRAVQPGTGEMGFGYLQPAAVQLEWMTIDRQRIERAVSVDRIESRKRWSENRDQFPGEYADERENVDRALRDEAVDRALRDADQVVRAAILQDVRQFPEVGRWRDLPDDWRERVLPLERIASMVADRLQERVGERIEPIVQRRVEWQRRNELRTLPGVGTSEVRFGPNAVPFDTLIFELREISGEEARAAQVGVPFGPVASPNGSLHYVRFTDARATGPAESLEQVRDRVVEDVKRLTAYELLLTRVDELREQMQTRGLVAITTQYPGAMVREGTVTRRSLFEENAPTGDDKRYRDAIVEAASRLDPTRPIADAPAEDRMLVVPVPSMSALALVEIKGRQPLTRDRYEEIASRTPLLATTYDAFVPEDSPFTYERLLDRLNARLTAVMDRIEGDEADAGTGDVDQPAPETM